MVCMWFVCGNFGVLPKLLANREHIATKIFDISSCKNQQFGPKCIQCGHSLIGKCWIETNNSKKPTRGN